MKLKGKALVVAASLLFAICLIPAGWAAYSAIVYLTTDSRFEVRKLSVSGLKRVEENQVLAKAGFETGTNVFRVKLDKIRDRVEQLPWVRYAMVERVLPDKIIIKIVEREPIGLARINGEVYQFDSDAKILEPDPVGGTSFPILDGLRIDDPKGNAGKVDVYRRVVEDLGQPALSEVHISDAQDVTVVSASDPLLVNLGTMDFRIRWIKYLQLKPQIQQQYPQAVRVDLRFKNQVIVKMKDDDSGEKIVWGVKKNTL
ncbi:MAG TPA: FtsQ-type POTRA domain-containing protein [Terriglobia bacterium]|jgi:cell division protein FtsQ